MGRVSEEYTRLSIAIAAADIAGNEKEVARLRLRQQVEVAMTGINDKFIAAKAKMDDGVGGALAALAALEAEKDRLPVEFFERERLRIVREVRFADQDAMRLLAEYQTAAMAEVRAMRAAAEATVDPATRMADMMERKQLADSPLDADALVERAREMLDAGQPKRAALFLDAAADKGGSMTAHDVREVVEQALDGAIPERAKAMSVETDVYANVAAFRAARLRQLFDARLGVRGDGSGEVGNGGSDVDAASLAAKVEAFANARATGQPYVDPVPETSGVGPDSPPK